MTLRVGYAGMTHLGVNSAAAAAGRGHDVVGFDPDPAVIADLKAGRPPVTEPGLPELLRTNAGRFTWTHDPGSLRDCQVVTISADIPTDDRGRSDLSGIRGLIECVAKHAAPDATLVLLSQVPPGFSRALTRPAGEPAHVSAPWLFVDVPPGAPPTAAVTGASLDAGRFFYQVETLIFGRAVERALHPERFMVGAHDPTRPLPEPYRRFLEAFECPILVMRYESAELAKISINCCLVASVTVANTLAEICEHIGADWSEIAPALRLDRRIGQHSYLAPGLGISGGNLERDLATVSRMATAVGSEATLMDAFVRNSAHRKDWALRTLYQLGLGAHPEATVAVLGLAYKENTHSVKNSPSLALIEHLGPWPLRVYDPVVPASAAAHPRVQGSATALEAATGADYLVLMTAWPEFRSLVPGELAKVMRGRTIVDPFKMLEPSACEASGFTHVVLGAPTRRDRGGSADARPR